MLKKFLIPTPAKKNMHAFSFNFETGISYFLLFEFLFIFPFPHNIANAFCNNYIPIKGVANYIPYFEKACNLKFLSLNCILSHFYLKLLHYKMKTIKITSRIKFIFEANKLRRLFN